MADGEDDIAGSKKVSGVIGREVRGLLGKAEDRPTWRVVLGYVLGLSALVGFGVLTKVVFGHLDALLDKDGLKDLAPQLFIAYVASHAVATVALVWFLYQLLKVAERMSMPSYYIDQVISREPSIIRSLLGVEDPSASLKMTAGQLEAASKSLAEAAKSMPK